MNTFSGSLTAQGSATVSQLAGNVSYTTPANGNTVSFTYDGSSAIVIFLGVQDGGFPFPDAIFDNVSVANAIPEPSMTFLLGLSALGALTIRRRK